MTQALTEAALVDSAQAIVEQLLARFAQEADRGMFGRRAAIQSCLSSAGALLDVSQALLRQPDELSPFERIRQWNELVGHTKTAGRGAYRAALILADPQTA